MRKKKSNYNNVVANNILDMCAPKSTINALRKRGYKTFTVGMSMSAGFGLSYMSEIAAAIDIEHDKGVRGAAPFATMGYGLGLDAGIDFSLTIGFAKVPYKGLNGNGQGVYVGAGGGVSAGIGVEYNYGSVDSDLKPELTRILFDVGAGAGVDIGYSRTHTRY